MFSTLYEILDTLCQKSMLISVISNINQIVEIDVADSLIAILSGGKNLIPQPGNEPGTLSIKLIRLYT